jgi:acyl-CoA hydrolase
MTVFLPGTAGESLGLFEALYLDPERVTHVKFIGVHFPEMNRRDYLGLHPTTTQRAYFAQPQLREPMRAGRVELMPLDYPGIWRDLGRQRIDLAFAQVSPPDENGKMSLGICYDFNPVAWARAAIRIAHVNARMPRTRGSFQIDLRDCDLVCEEPSPLITREPNAEGATFTDIGKTVANFVRNGDTVQMGVGKMQRTVANALRGHQRLRIHSGLVTNDVAELLDCGAVQGDACVVTGVALGDDCFYQRLSEDPSFYFRSVDETHDPCRIAQIPGFVSINAAIEVDLFGQINCDCLHGRFLAGVGGMPAFVAGARLSVGGRVIFCLTSTAGNPPVSRVVPKLGLGSAIGAPRYSVDVVITEHGSVELRELSVDQRAERLIGLAAPQFRESLAAHWSSIRANL